MITTKCESCFNSRPIISENGIHYSCCLSAKKARDCVFGDWKHYVAYPVSMYLRSINGKTEDEK